MKKATIAKLLVVCLIVSMMSMSIAAAPAPRTAGEVVGDTYKVTDGAYTLTEATIITDVSKLDSNEDGETTIDAGDESVTISSGTLTGKSVAITVNRTNTEGVTVASGVKLGTGAILTVNLSGGSAKVAVTDVELTDATAELTVFSKDETVRYKVTGKALVNITLNATSGRARAAEPANTVELKDAASEFYCLTTDKNNITVSKAAGLSGYTLNEAKDVPSAGYTTWTLIPDGSYAVNVTKTGNGTVTAPTSAAAGDEVTVNATPDEGNKVSAISGTYTIDGSVKKITFANDSNNVYTFTMPNAAVNVKVTFKSTNSSGSNGSGGGGGSTTPVKPTEPTEPTKPVFTDVPAGAYYADAVAWAVEKGITNGLTASTFGPEASCTRGQMVTFLWRLAGSPKAAGTNPFGDITADAYYYDAVMWAVEKGITSGTSADAFSPNATVSRAQSVTFLYRYAGSPAAEGGQSFGDVAADAYYANAVTWAAANDITNGTSATTFSPDSPCVRGQIVTFMYRYAGDK